MCVWGRGWGVGGNSRGWDVFWRDLSAQIELKYIIRDQITRKSQGTKFSSHIPSFSAKSKMAANRKAKVTYLGSLWCDFNNFGVYSRVFRVSEFIALVSEMIVRQCHSQKVIIEVKSKENVSCESFSLIHRLKWICCNMCTIIKW